MSLAKFLWSMSIVGVSMTIYFVVWYVRSGKKEVNSKQWKKVNHGLRIAFKYFFRDKLNWVYVPGKFVLGLIEALGLKATNIGQTLFAKFFPPHHIKEWRKRGRRKIEDLEFIKGTKLLHLILDDVRQPYRKSFLERFEMNCFTWGNIVIRDINAIPQLKHSGPFAKGQFYEEFAKSDDIYQKQKLAKRVAAAEAKKVAAAKEATVVAEKVVEKEPAKIVDEKNGAPEFTHSGENETINREDVLAIIPSADEQNSPSANTGEQIIPTVAAENSSASTLDEKQDLDAKRKVANLIRSINRTGKAVPKKELGENDMNYLKRLKELFSLKRKLTRTPEARAAFEETVVATMRLEAALLIEESLTKSKENITLHKGFLEMKDELLLLVEKNDQNFNNYTVRRGAAVRQLGIGLESRMEIPYTGQEREPLPIGHVGGTQQKMPAAAIKALAEEK